MTIKSKNATFPGTSEQLLEMYYEVIMELFEPPEPWTTFGTHVEDADTKLVFWGTAPDGLPLWERPA